MVISLDPRGPTSRKVLRMASKNDLWMDMYASASIRRGLSAASVLENQGSEESLSRDGSLPSCSSSSERNKSTEVIGEAAEAIAKLEDGEVRAMLQDAKVRAVLRKVTINEGMLNTAIQSLGGGEKGLQSLMEYIMVWVKQQRASKSSQSPPPPSNPPWNFSSAQHVLLQPSSDAFQILSGVLQSPPTTQPLDQEMRYTHQPLKSRKLTTGEPKMGGGRGGSDTQFCDFCPSSFISSTEDCKPDVTSPDVMSPCSPQQQQPVTPFTRAHIAMPSIEPTLAMTTKAARRHRMSRQRQSFHARTARPFATRPVSVGGGSLWSSKAATSPAVASSARKSRIAHVTAAWEVRKGHQPNF